MGHLGLSSSFAGNIGAQGEQVVFTIAEEGHPEIVGAHFSDEVRRVFDANITFDEDAVGTMNVRHFEIKY